MPLTAPSNARCSLHQESSPPCSEATRSRALELLQTEIDFIPNAEFQSHSYTEDADVTQALASTQETPNKLPENMPAHLGRICETALLSQELERALFREMNFCKFRANMLRSRICPDQVDPQAIEAIDSLLGRARQIRDLLITSNTRLVISIVKKFVSPQLSFDELLSDGIFILMRAVDKFDFSRGFRFSTYVYRSITRDAYQATLKLSAEEKKVTRDGEEWAFVQETESSSSMDEQTWSTLSEATESMLTQLDRREQFIIRCRYALGAHRKARTFQYIGDKLGISKERARQLERRSIAKLQNLAANFNFDEPSNAAFA